MTPELLALLGSIVGGTGALLSYWAGWRARDKWDRSSRRGSDRSGNGNCAPLPPAPPYRNPFVSEFQQQINYQLGPTTPKPDIIPKPHFPPPRTIPGNQP
jgi:hypothetical protein